MMTRTPLIISGTVVALVAAVGTGFLIGSNDTGLQPGSVAIESTPNLTDTTLPTDTESGNDSEDITELLTYLVEEEKLAHDVYIALGDIWGDRVFANIARSESKHQDQVATLLADYGIADPRSAEPGVFQNAELQALYDTLVEQGAESRIAAINVGILIEETDIRDLQAAIDAIADAEIDATLERLLNASYNHLDAFTRQL